jgi:hypothetical protein
MVDITLHTKLKIEQYEQNLIKIGMNSRILPRYAVPAKPVVPVVFYVQDTWAFPRTRQSFTSGQMDELCM